MNKSELQTLRHILRSAITEIKHGVKFQKVIAGELYTRCNPTDPETESAYRLLNHVKARVRYLKSRNRKLAHLSTVVRQNVNVRQNYKDSVGFSARELQALLNVVRAEIANYETAIRIIDSEIKVCYANAIPGTLEGQVHFEVLNALRDERRYFRKRVAKSAKVSRALKDELKRINGK